MRPLGLNAIATACGVVLAIAVLGAAANVPPPGLPSTIVAAGTSVMVPGFHNLSFNGNSTCGGTRCGSPGEQWIQFSVGLQARLSGTLQSDVPIELLVGNAGGLTAACNLPNPPPACAPPPLGSDYLYQTPSRVSTIHLGELNFNFVGATNLLPAGSWTILLINWGDTPVVVRAVSPVLVTPTW